jgi:hypothetical protein
MIKDAKFLSEMLLINPLIKILASQIPIEMPVVCMWHMKDKAAL